jgi:hypothetical protein
MSRVVLHVDRLVLAGFPEHERTALVEGLELGLSRALVDPGGTRRLRALGDVAQLRAGSVRVGAGTPAQRTGAAMGRRIAAEISR